MKEVLARLNPDQREVALYRGHCLTIACPGSGKTATLAAKAAFLLSEEAKVAAVTFTRDAALELRERIVNLAGPTCRSRLLVGTFHSIDMLMAFPTKNASEYGRTILRDMRSPYTEPWKIINEGVRRSYVLRAMAESGVSDLTLENASSIIEAAKESRSTIGLETNLQEMVALYIELMERSKQIDFQDIILKTNDALRAKTMTPLNVDYLLIDEYQDTDKAQYEWSLIHGKAGIPITAVGDDDQSIYGFRRALGYDGMDKFAKEFHAHRILLGTNYRCKSEILKSAEILIGRNSERIPKRLFANKGSGGVVTWESFAGKIQEANAAVEMALSAQIENASFCVIARTNNELDEIERAMIDRKIPFRRADNKSIFDTQEVQVYGAILRTLIKPTPNDVDQVLAWAGMPSSDCMEIRRLFGNTICIGSKNDFNNSSISDTGMSIWRSFAKKHAEWVDGNEKHFYNKLFKGVHEWLLEMLRKPNRAELLEIANSLYVINDEDKTSGETLFDRLATIRKAELFQKEKEVPENAAFLTTAHGSKGLEFDRVWIIGLADGVFPSKKSSVEEERRLMFVAMTRARELLWISATNDKKPSIFVDEAGLR